MAEAFARHAGIATASAGTDTVTGWQPTAEAVTVMDESGIDIRHHRATPIDRLDIDDQDTVWVMTETHRSDLAHRGIASELLDPDGEIRDPYGHDLDTYRAVRDQIRAAVESRIAPA
jgi:protein-tyrosine-phosphatase